MTEASPPRRRRILRTLFITGFLLAPVAVFFHFRDDSEPPANPYAKHLPPQDLPGEKRFTAAAADFRARTSGIKDDELDTYETNLPQTRLALMGFNPAIEESRHYAVFSEEAETFLRDNPLRFPSPSPSNALRTVDGTIALKTAYKVLSHQAVLHLVANQDESAYKIWERHKLHDLDIPRAQLNIISALTCLACEEVRDTSLLETAYHTQDAGLVSRAIQLHQEDSLDEVPLLTQTAAGEFEFCRAYITTTSGEMRRGLKRTSSGFPDVSSIKEGWTWASTYWRSINILPNATIALQRDSLMKMVEPGPIKTLGPAYSTLETSVTRNCGGKSLCQGIALPICRTYFLGKKPAYRALRRAALAIRLYELTHGHRPDSLSKLTPDILPTTPTDPFDGVPVRYDAARGLLWSVGNNSIDDHGDEDKDIRLWLPGCEPPDAVSVFDQEKKRKAAEAAAP